MPKNSTTITVAGRHLRTERRLVPIQELIYYADNPRIYTILQALGQNPSQDEIGNELWNLGTTKDLFRDIKDNEGLMEDIIVHKSTVLEGNSRLCAYRKLHAQASSTQEQARWNSIPSTVILDDISRVEVFALLGTFHIRGKAKWQTFEQAAYVWRMKHELKKTPEEIADLIGVNPSQLIPMLKAYEMMVKEGIVDLHKFSYFLEYKKRPGFNKLRKQHRKQHKDLDKAVSDAIKEDRIHHAADMRGLEHIIADKKASKLFFEKKAGYDEALELAHANHPEQEDTFYKKIGDVRDLLRNAPILDLRDQIKKDTTRRAKVAYFIKEVYKFGKEVGFDGTRWNDKE